MCQCRRNFWKRIFAPKVSALSLLKKVTFGAVTAGLAFSAHAAQIHLEWDPPTNADGTPITTLAGYKLYYGPNSRTYPTNVTVGNHTTFTLDGLEAGTTYYFAVTAYDQAGIESEYSQELQATLEMPESPPPAEPPPTEPPPSTTEPTSTPNLASNSDMESGLWTSSAFAGTKPSTTWATDFRHSGARALKMNSQIYFYGAWHSTPVPTSPGQNYELSMWVKTQAITHGVSLNIRWLDASNRDLSRISGIGGKVTGTNDWKQLQGMVTAPSNAAKAVVQIRVESTGGSAWVDDVVFRFVTAPTQTPVPTPTPTPSSIVSVWLEAEEGDIQTAAEPDTLPNLISNSDVESGMWTSGAFAGTKPVSTWATDAYHSGTHALKMMSGIYFYGYWTSASLPVSPGKNYTVSMWVQTAAITNGVSLNVTWYDASNRSLNWSPAVGGKMTGTQAWRLLQGIVTAPANAARAVIQIRVESTGGSAWVDDVVFQAEGALPPSIEVAVDDSASARAYVWVANSNEDVLDPEQPGEMVRYSFTVTSASTYTIWGRVRPGEDGLGSFFVNVSPTTMTEATTYHLWDVATLTTASNTTTAAPTWGWRQVNDPGIADPVRFSLAPGEYTLTLKPREAGTKLDRLLITNDLQYVPQGYGALN
jgi:hypothetical protein